MKVEMEKPFLRPTSMLIEEGERKSNSYIVRIWSVF